MLKLTTIFFIIAFAMLAILHVIAIELSLYWFYRWFDMPMHFLGGTVVALGIFTLNDFRLWVRTEHLALVPILLLALVVMLGWEVFELLAGIPVQADFIRDTIEDLILGSLGVVTGYYVAKQIRTL